MSQKKKLPLIPPRETKLTREILTEHFHSNLHFERRWTDVFAELLTQKFGTVTFFLANAALFGIWLSFNSGIFGTAPFDPYPFNFLTMVVSLEAIFLSVIVLISQNRQSRIADVRQQMDFEIDVRAEEEITKILHLLGEIRGGRKRDPELEQMKLRTDLEEIQRRVEQNEENQ